MPNFFENFISLWSKPFRDKQQEQAPEQQLQGLWVDTKAIDEEVTQKMNTSKEKHMSIDKQREILSNAPEWSDPQAIISGLVQRGYTLEGLDTTAIQEEQAQPTQLEEEKSVDGIPLEDVDIWGVNLWEAKEAALGIKGGLSNIPLIGKVPFIWKLIDDNIPEVQKEMLDNFKFWGIAQWSKIAWNLMGFFADIFTKKDAEGAWDKLREMWEEGKALVQEITGVDPESLITKAWELTGTIWTSLLIPWPKVGLTWPIANIASKSPKLFNFLKSAAAWATEIWKFQAISEWEVTKWDLITWAILWPAFDKFTKVLSWPTAKEVSKRINNRFAKLATKLSPSKTTKVVLDKEIAKGTEWAFLIRKTNPDIVLTWDDAITNVVEASRKTRTALFREAEKARGVWNIKPDKTVKWIDDMIDSLKDPKKQKALLLDKKLWKEFTTLDNIQDQWAVIKALEKQKANILAKWERSLSQWDNLIIDRNKSLEWFFNKSSADKVDSQVSAAIWSQMKQNLDDTIWLLWNNFRQLKQAYGNVRVFENNLNKVYAQVLRKKDAQLWDFADTFILSNMATSIAAWDVAWLSKALLQKGIKEKIKASNDPNVVLQEMFKLIDRELKIAPSTITETIKRPIISWAKKGRDFLQSRWIGSNFNKVSPTKSAEIKVLKQAIKDSPKTNIGFHWTNKEFDVFLDKMVWKGATAKFGDWVYLSSSPKVAKTYADLMGWLKWGKPRLLEVAIPDSLKIKTYDWPITGLKKAWEEARKAWFKGIKYNTWDDIIKLPWRSIDTAWHSNYIIFSPSDAKIIKNNVIKELGAVKWLWLLRDLLAWSIVWLSWVQIALDVKQFLDTKKKEQKQKPTTTPRW